MSENIAYKFGGTSNNTAETIMRCIEIGGDGIAMTVSAPGALSDKQLQRFGDYSHIPEGIMRDKVTDNLLNAYDEFNQPGGELNPLYVDAVTARFAVNVYDLGLTGLQGLWLRNIAHRIRHAVQSPTPHKTAIIGEQLQADIYEQMGFYKLNPAKAKLPLLVDPKAWDSWLADFDRSVGRVILPGSITTDGKNPLTGRGWGDATACLLARALGADENHIVSDYPLYSYDPRVVGKDKARHVPHITYYEAGDLHETGTKTFHPAGIPPMVKSGIPTMAYALNDPNGLRTVYTDDITDQERLGRVVAASLMNVDVLSVLEPGMSTRHGRIEEITAAIKALDINIEHIADFGSYGISIVLDAETKRGADGVHKTDKAEEALLSFTNGSGEVLREEQAMITVVGREIIKSSTHIDSILGPITDQYTSRYPHRFEGPHAKRVTVDREHGKAALIEAHRALIEKAA